MICCDKHDEAWQLFMTRIDRMPMRELLKESRPARRPDRSLERKRRHEAEADRLIREYQHRHELNKVTELERLAAIERRKAAARVTDQQTKRAIAILERKTA